MFFDERFVNYGCNKVQYVDLIRHRGYKFYILINSFAMDLVHHDSAYRKTYLDKLRVGTRPIMKIICENFQARVQQVFKTAENQTQICRRNNLYIEL
ncbi:uncharacterized protein [Blastocystis hominis]|uniref:Uncharacterized protein n=1 Tax=Blastocystis hominis TaxID=12968 RepID=D8LXE5_BLAHO|nr:uncharacterized protein [Blastocystis hominis]CBK20940.2 unnamed protein product [Blastocystis hominis]|eukprot:XP_012894988.1 uncharacterized protein [Blastocystis hominis]